MADLIKEGEVTFDAGGVFYKPRMKLNRDIGVTVTRSLGISEYLGGLAAHAQGRINMDPQTRINIMIANIFCYVFFLCA